MIPPLLMLLDSSIRISAVAAVVGLAVIVGRIRSSSLRHKAWVAVLCAMLLMPVLPYLVPSLPVPIPAAPGFARVAAMDPGPAIIEPPAPFPASRATAGTGASASLPARPPTWPEAILSVYAAGVFAFLWRLFAGWFSVQRVVRTSKPVAVDKPRVYESASVFVPVTVGLRAPKVLLPGEWNEWPEDKLRAVLAHEWAHVERRDTVTRLLAQVNRCVFWFHPLAWWLERHLTVVSEQACDDAGVRAIGASRRYAEVLLDMAEAVRRRGSRLTLQGVGVDGTGLLGRRIDRVLRGVPCSGGSRLQRASLAVFCAVSILAAAACRQDSIYIGALKPDPRPARDVSYDAGRDRDPSASRCAEIKVAKLKVAERKGGLASMAAQVSYLFCMNAVNHAQQLNDRIRQAVGNEPSEAQYKSAAALPETERFQFLPYLAEQAYIQGNMADYYSHDRLGATKDWDLARRYAQDELQVTPRFRNDANYGPAVYLANMTLGMVAMRVDGDRKAAAKYLLAASAAPTTDGRIHFFTTELPVLLIKYGGPAERRAVIEYLERYGKIFHRRDLDLLYAAKQLRQGYMPIWYQYQAAKLK